MPIRLTIFGARNGVMTPLGQLFCLRPRFRRLKASLLRQAFSLFLKQTAFICSVTQLSLLP